MKKLLCSLASAIVLCTAAQGAMFTYSTALSGPAESPANNSLGTGFSTVIYDSLAHTLQVDVTFSGLTGNTTASHIHCCALPTAGVATVTPTFTGFPSGVASGTYSHLFDLTLAGSWNASFLNNATNAGSTANAEATLAAGLASGVAYLNVHTTVFPGGEIRGFLTPEPATGVLTGLAFAALWAARRRFNRA